MKRIIMMVLRNLLFVPYLWIKLCYYAKKTDHISDEKKDKFLKYIVYRANTGGNVVIKSSGEDLIPKEESFMLFPNHQGMYDVLALVHTCPRFFSVVMKQELKDVPFIKQVIAIMKGYVIDRDDVRQSMKVIQQVSKDVSEGTNFMIFPEGTRSRNGNQIGEFKGGSFKSATKAKCPIVPVAIIDSYQAFDTHSVREVVVQVHYLEPMYYEEYKDMKTTAIAEEVSRRIRNAIELYEKA